MRLLLLLSGGVVEKAENKEPDGQDIIGGVKSEERENNKDSETVRATAND